MIGKSNQTKRNEFSKNSINIIQSNKYMAFIISDKMERWNKIGRKLISCDLFPVWMAIFMRAHFFFFFM